MLDKLKEMLTKLFNGNGIVAALGLGTAIAVIAGIAHHINITMHR
ncbi:hypothetical protein [Corynebacterium marambiense]|nr:hypothetical protein [Corynebacterium marambiense]